MTIIVDEITIGSAITPFLTDVVDRAQAAHPIPGDVDPAFVRSLTDRLWEEATHIWFRILLEEFHSFRERQGLPRNPEGANALALFSAHLHRSDHRAVLVERWPVAMDLLEQRAGMLREAVCEVARSWEQDRDRLVAEGIVGADFLPIRVVLGEGDSHYGGRTVTLLTDDAGHHVIHKPRSAAPDDLLARLLHTFGQLVGEDLTACAPRTVAGNSGAWQQFVSTVDPATPEEATSYFRRFGMLCALMAAIGAGDLHHENVLVCGPTPCIIDTETLLQPGVVPHDGLLESEVLHAGEHAPGSTLMLPVRVRTGAFDVFVCALGIPWTRQSHKETFELVDDGSDAVRMERANVRITHHANVAHLYGEPLNPLDYLDAIVEGYLTTHRVVRDHTRAMMDVLSSAAETRFRVVLRPTEVYAKFIDASVQASALASESERAQLLNLVRDLDVLPCDVVNAL